MEVLLQLERCLEVGVARSIGRGKSSCAIFILDGVPAIEDTMGALCKLVRVNDFIRDAFDPRVTRS